MHPEQIYRVLRAGALTTKQVCQRLGITDTYANRLLTSLPGIHRGKIGSQKHIWSLE